MDDYHIELSLDWGTFKWVAAYAICHKGKRIGPPSLVLISDSTYEVRMMAAWIDGRLVQGRALEDAADSNTVLSDMIVDHFKLCLYEGPESADVKKRVEDTLAEVPGGKTVDMLVSEHLKAVIEDIKEGIKTSGERFHLTEQELDVLLERMHVRITVPQIWMPPARRRMQKAAKAAGLKVVVLAYEPRCALAYLIDKVSKKQFSIGRNFGKDDTSLIIDAGSGTADLSFYRLQEDLDPSSRLRLIGKDSGEICGSFKIDELLYDSLVKRKGREWVIKSVGELQVTERDFKRRALMAIEKIKRDFTKKRTMGTDVIRGIGKGYVAFEITREEFICAHDKVIAKMFERIDDIPGKQTPDLIQLTGGFSKSWYLMEKIRERYEKDGTIVVRPNVTDTLDSFPVAVGALYRYDDITPRSLPSTIGYALLQREHYDEKTHKDSRYTKRGLGGVFRKKEWVKPSPYDEAVYVVDDRIINLVRRGTVLKPGQVWKERVCHEYFLPVDKPEISAEFVCLLKDFLDHAASRIHDEEPEDVDEDNGEDQRCFKDGVTRWASVKLSLAEFNSRLKGFETGEDSDGQKFYKIRARVFIRAVQQDMQVGFEVLKPSKPTKRSESSTDDESDEEEDEYPGEAAFKVEEKIWEESFSEFAQL